VKEQHERRQRLSPLDEHRNFRPARAAGRMRVISENIANADLTAKTAGGDPYRRKILTFSSELDRTIESRVVTLGKIKTDTSDFRVKHEPGNPSPMPTATSNIPT
jgi:flagellar basal body rod protein FlgC